MLSKEAIDTITATAIAASGAPLDTHVPAMLVPKGYELHKLEHLQARPARFRGAFNTHSIEAFAEYVKRHAAHDQSTGFIDQRAMKARVLFDLGTALYPGFGEHTAILELEQTAPYNAINCTVSRPLKQQQMIDFVEDWAPHITPRDQDGAPIAIPAAIDAIRRMHIETKGARDSEIGDFNTKRSALEEIEAKSKGRLPRSLEFTCIPYECLDPITIRQRISVLTGHDEPIFCLHWLNQASQSEAIAANFRDVLTDAIDGAVPLTLGTFAQYPYTTPAK